MLSALSIVVSSVYLKTNICIQAFCSLSTILSNCLIFLQTAFGLIELSHPDNSIPVNRFVTPLHIVPEWYFLAYYAVLKVIPSKTGGLLVFMLSTCQ
ncbi:putative apocytochrome b [Besnoitia besnoiti]|uniref:Cytochrome b n=1 Tax=Besnoitia besnoiti TaxID=94643 RepID=A0A2A9M5K1_BESBE|nr:putative apocytochrome b [Besnoitia besnoiti]PFH30917.1 putative apocytochrome b [Besnoitia besnoiti]